MFAWLIVDFVLAKRITEWCLQSFPAKQYFNSQQKWYSVGRQVFLPKNLGCFSEAAAGRDGCSELFV